jgi:hypothetical protein
MRLLSGKAWRRMQGTDLKLNIDLDSYTRLVLVCILLTKLFISLMNILVKKIPMVHLKGYYIAFLKKRNIFQYSSLWHKTMHIVISYYRHGCHKKIKTISLWNNVKHYVKVILLLKDHPLDAKISIDVVSSTRHSRIMWGCSPSFCSNTQQRIQWVPQKITCIGVTTRVLLKIMSFLLNQNAQHKADAPTRILYISFLLIPFSHLVNICAMFTGCVILKGTCTILHIILVIWQSKKRCSMVSSRL